MLSQAKIPKVTSYLLGRFCNARNQSSRRFVGNTGVEECEAKCHERGLGERCLRGALGVVDDEELDGTGVRLELQAELLLQGGRAPT